MATAGVNHDDDDHEEKYIYTYMGMRENVAIPPPSFHPPERGAHGVEEVDEASSLLYAGETMDMALFQNLTEPITRDEASHRGWSSRHGSGDRGNILHNVDVQDRGRAYRTSMDGDEDNFRERNNDDNRFGGS
jgi:hypothetical protein